jgi:enoyl-CoA hydratase/carnithine racemase
MIALDVTDDGVAIIALDRPEQLNIVDMATRGALRDAIEAVRDHPDARALVLRANGRHFSAGADLTEFGNADSVFEARRIRWDVDPWGTLWDLPQPSVVALHGYALAAGLEMALLCDIRLAAPDTVLGLPETKLGMLPAAGGTQSLTRAVGPVAALPIVATAENLSAADALRRGLVHRVVEDVEGEAMAIARRWARLDPGALRSARRALRAAGDLPLAQGLELEGELARRA